MKKLSKVFLSLALVLVMAIPMLTMTGCDLSDLFGGNKDKDGDKTISRIELTDDVKTEYTLNDAFDKQDAKLRVVYTDESDKVVNIATNMISGFNSTTIGDNKTMTITYAEKTLSINYNVKYPFELGKYIPLNDAGTSFHKMVDCGGISVYECFEFDSNGTLICFTSNISGERLTNFDIGEYASYGTGTWSYSDGKIVVLYDSHRTELFIENNTKLYQNVNAGGEIYKEYIGKI